MAKAVITRQFGDEYQQLVFWKYALDMLSGNHEISNILYEDKEVKSYDDVVIEYVKPQNFRNSTYIKKYIQVKFHIRDEDFFTLDNLLDPAFINAEKKSLLDNVVAAYRQLGDEFENCVFVIYSMWDIAQGDVLYELINNVDRTIDIDKLSIGKTERSKMGGIRKKLCTKLGVDERELGHWGQGTLVPCIITKQLNLVNIFLKVHGTNFVWDGDQLVMELSDSGKVKKRYIRGNDLVLADEGKDSETTFYVMDSHGNVVQLTDESGKVKKTYEYDSFGNEVKPKKKDENPFRYCGEYYDKETEEVYLRARYYQPAVGRFLTRDSYTGESDEPESLHLYTYCENDGVNSIDPIGHDAMTVRDVFDTKSDWAGRKILNHYLYGNGKPLVFFNEKKWTEYMTKNKKLLAKTKKKVLRYSKKVKRGKKKTINKKTSMEIENGEQIIGYQYLHGTNIVITHLV